MNGIYEPPFKPQKIDLQIVWKAAENYVRTQGYRITIEDFEDLLPDWPVYIINVDQGHAIAFVIHEAVEYEELKRVTGKWINGRDYQDKCLKSGTEDDYKTCMIILMNAHIKAQTREEEYLVIRSRAIEDAEWYIERNYHGKKVTLNPVSMLKENQQLRAPFPEDVFIEALKTSEKKLNLRIDWERYEAYKRIMYPKRSLYGDKTHGS